MHVSCPECATVYEVPDSRLKPGRRLRCSQCGAQWAPIPAPEPEPVAEVAQAKVAQPEAAPVVESPTEDTAIEPPPPPPKPAVEKQPEAVEKSKEEAPALRTAPALQAPAIMERPVRLVPPDEQPMPVRRRPRLAMVPLVMAWALSLALVSVGSWGAYQYRGMVMKVWPPSERAYAALGLD